MSLATIGNYQKLRNSYFKFRTLCSQKKINYLTINKKTLGELRVISSTENWTLHQANEVYKTLKMFSGDLRAFNIPFGTDILPKLESPFKTSKKTQIKRIESLTYTNNKFELFLNYSKTKVNNVRAIQGAKYDSEKRSWIFGSENIDEVKNFCDKYQIQISYTARKIIEQYDGNFEQSYSAKRVDLNINMREGFDFFDYQTVGVSFGIRTKRVWITDQMGLGKTLQGIGIAVGLNQYPILIICPKSLRYNWKLEIEKFSYRRALIADKKNMKKMPEMIQNGMVDFLIMNYDGVKTHFLQEIKKTPTKNGRVIKTVYTKGIEQLFKGVIIDESHELKNSKSDRFKVTKKVVNHMDIRILLSGTPFVNEVKDIANQLDILGRIDEFCGTYKFCQDYSGITKSNFNSGKASGKKQRSLKDLNIKLRSICMIRREKWQVLKELPDKVRRVLKIELTNRKDYDHAYINLQDYLVSIGASENSISASERANLLAQMQVLKKLSATGKVEQISREIQELHENGEKVILFCWHLSTVESYRKIFPNLVEITGNVTDEKIEENKERFQNHSDCNLIVITYKKGGVGHTLTAASHVYFGELGWNTKDQDQAEDRAHRIGQKNNVTAHYCLGENTIDEHIYSIIQKKRKLSEESLGSEEEIEISEEKELINLLQKK